LEKARTSGGTHVELSEAGHKYRVDVKKMEQINIKTKVARKVQRTCNGMVISYVCLVWFYFTNEALLTSRN